MGGKNFRLVLDTGCPIHGAILIGNSRVEGLDLEYVGQVMAGGVGGEPVPADFSTGVTIQFPGLELTDQCVIVMPKNSFGGTGCPFMLPCLNITPFTSNLRI